MMQYKKLVQGTVAVILCLVLLSIMSLSLLATVLHEDPETAQPVFSGIALLRYYADALDFVLVKNPVEVEARLGKMPFASIPLNLVEATDSFAASSTNVSQRVAWVDADLSKMRALVGQFRLDEAKTMVGPISDNLSWANSELTQVRQSTQTIGIELAVSATPLRSDLRRSYDEVVARINRVGQMLALYQKLLTELRITAEGIKPTAITLEIQPSVAFVGDNIRFEGVLTAEQKPLAGRQVYILINFSLNVTATTDAYGHYQGVLPVPYIWYLPQMIWQALYYPQDKDIGLYVASLSPVVKLNVLYYEANLEVNVEGKAYPGREATVSGRFDYGQAPPPRGERTVEFYLGNVFITTVAAGETFVRKIPISPQTEVGTYALIASVRPASRYAPISARTRIDVAKATPVLDLTLPRVALMPGSVRLGGKLDSEVGPLSVALIKMRLANSQVELASADDGTFDTKIGMGVGWGMVGWQDLAIQVLPREPWYTPLNTTSRVLMVNMLNIGGFLAILVFLGIYLPRRLRRRLGAYPGRAARPVVAGATSEPVPVSSLSPSVAAPAVEREPDSGGPRSRIFYWYRLIVRLLLRIAQISLRPQQTLREFADENSRLLGPAAKYFNELTRMVEKLLYSPYRPTEADVESSRQLSLGVEEAVKPEVATMANDLYRKGNQGGTKE